MKKILYIFCLIVIPLIGSTQNDTLITRSNYKYKIGVKGLYEKSVASFTPETKTVYNFGLQGIYRFGNSKSSLESGIYFFNKMIDAKYKDPVSSNSVINEINYKNIHIPVNYRLDTRIIYFSFGVYTDYLFTIKADNLVDYKEQNLEDRKYNFGINGSIGIEKPISPKITFFVEGEFSSNLTSSKKEHSFFYFNDTRAFQFANYGFALGINYKLLKH